jgi:hypothetical protein
MAKMIKKMAAKPMKKAEYGSIMDKKPKKKTYPIISESGDLADALNETMRQRRTGTVPKTGAGIMKQVDKWNKEGKLGPSPKKKMGGKVMKKKK